MKLIKSIKIKNFRSFLGTTKKDPAEVLEITDLTIFSGSNDSGKSNILRALNLFFNGETNRGEMFDYKKDLNIYKRSSGARVVEIQVAFDISWDKDRDKFLPSEFFISKFYDVNGFRNYLCEFKIKNIESVIKIDSRPENNKRVYLDFLPPGYVRGG